MFDLSNYEPVKDRIERFYADHPDGCIRTELVNAPDSVPVFAAFKALALVGGEVRATGYAMEERGQNGVNRDAWVENAETSAIGRALANLGYCGTLRPSREEMEKIQPAQPSEWDTWKATSYPAIRDGFGEAGKILQWTQNKMDDMGKMVKEMLKSHDIAGLKALSLDVAIQVEAQRDAGKAAKAEPVQAEIF